MEFIASSACSAGPVTASSARNNAVRRVGACQFRIVILSIYPSSFKPQRCWLPALTPVTYLSKLLGLLRLPPSCNLKAIGYR
ncbi:TPA: hypothetical protein JD344_09430 [Serratia marcescens]|nr:hypothetical protein [Serratia marcescens]HAU5718802.1 hypothetical protein [Serratia marcescens]HAU5738961.1 hypothetical protein [Serratia marcescens]HAU5742445.1 hypothetical protein [Serratia marcescens]HAU5744777.1 hypothetical protein [Serratia marcescens]